MKILKRIFVFFKKRIKKISFLLPFIYLLVYLIGLILYFISKQYPDFIDFKPCFVLAGNTVCTYLGLYLTAVSSMPGYLISSSIFKAVYLKVPIPVTYVMVVGLSVIFYYFVGLVLEKIFKFRSDPVKLSKLIIIASIIGLGFLLLVRII